MRLLLIEDHEQNGQIFLRMLDRAGYRDVDWQRDGLTGLEAGARGGYDAILIDLDLPILDGMQVALALYRQMREGRLTAMPLVALTARTDPATRAEAARMGFRAWLTKPCTADALAETLRRVLTGGA